MVSNRLSSAIFDNTNKFLYLAHIEISHTTLQIILPSNGTASEVAGIVSATIFKNTVNDNKIVTPMKRWMRGK